MKRLTYLFVFILLTGMAYAQKAKYVFYYLVHFIQRFAHSLTGHDFGTNIRKLVQIKIDFEKSLKKISLFEEEKVFLSNQTA